jgi:hypothetical protein
MFLFEASTTQFKNYYLPVFVKRVPFSQETRNLADSLITLAE